MYSLVDRYRKVGHYFDDRDLVLAEVKRIPIDGVPADWELRTLTHPNGRNVRAFFRSQQSEWDNWGTNLIAISWPPRDYGGEFGHIVSIVCYDDLRTELIRLPDQWDKVLRSLADSPHPHDRDLSRTTAP